MESLKELYRVGHGPSSSHTMGPQRAAEIFLKRFPDAPKYRVILYGSLASTGKGHLTDVTLKDIFKGKTLSLKLVPGKELPYHPNGMVFECFSGKKIIGKWQVYSVGGGALSEGRKEKKKSVYSLNKMDDILKWCTRNRKKISDYVIYSEGNEILGYLEEIWDVMKKSIKAGLGKKRDIAGRTASSEKSQPVLYEVKKRKRI